MTTLQKGVYLPTQTLLKHKKGNASGKKLYIIATSTIGSITPSIGLTAYQASKSALNRFVEFIDTGYREKNVIAHAFHPGGIVTDLSSAAMPAAMIHLLSDTAQLPGGFVVWLCATKEADKLAGRYCSANWDVKELLQAIKNGALDNDSTLKLRPV